MMEGQNLTQAQYGSNNVINAKKHIE